MAEVSASEWIALTELVARYALALDEKNWSLLADVLDDRFGSWRIFFSRESYEENAPARVTSGKDAVVLDHRTSLERLQTHHQLGNYLIDIEGDRASLSVYFRAYHQGTGARADLFEHSMACAKIQAVRCRGVWRMRELDYIIWLFQGSMEVFAEH